MIFNSNNIRMEVVACLSVANNGDASSLLTRFGPKEETDMFESNIAEILSISEEEREAYIIERLKAYVAREDFVALAEIHPAWLVEVLSKESPRIIGIVLRYLPSKQVRYIIEHLPKRIKHRLPQLIDSFAVPAPILKIIKNRFEKQFATSKGRADFVDFDFNKIPYLKSKDLLVLFRDLGVQELAMALKGVDKRSLTILFNRLSVDEARALQQRIRSLVDVSDLLLRDSKYTVLELSIAEAETKDLLLEVGLNAFAKAVNLRNVNVYSLIKQKLEPRISYMLKRYIDQHIDSNSDAVCDKRQNLVLKRVETLAKAESIDKSLCFYFTQEAETQIMQMPSVDNLVQEKSVAHVEEHVK